MGSYPLVYFILLDMWFGCFKMNDINYNNEGGTYILEELNNTLNGYKVDKLERRKFYKELKIHD